MTGTTSNLTPTARIRAALQTVTDPEIPVISVVELGIIQNVYFEGPVAVVEMCPTFAGCPALDVMRADIARAVEAAGFDEVRVRVVFYPPWTTDRITPAGREKLKSFGLAPPSACTGSGVTEAQIADVACPFCGATDTALESIFGPTLCRSIHYCNACSQSFEQFKPLG